MIQVYNTLTRRKEELRPAHPDGVLRMYECGLTVYDEPHIGNARINVIFDTLHRWLEFRGIKVIHVRNVTDVEDKIIKRSAERGIAPEELVAKYDALRKELYARLNILPATHEPYASAHIPEIVALIERLFAAGLAYQAGSDVYFHVRKFPSYGKLSGQSLDQVLPGARIEPGEFKQDPLDFTLWKGAKPGEPKWDSPWGPGRPGWHIECSAMSIKYLGETLDLHGGGSDLIFPHHEDEIAQSEGATGKQFVRIWMHAGFLTMSREKMSKSLGNILSLREVMDRLPTPAMRLLMCQTHYRSPLEWSDDGERQARETLETLRRQLEPPQGPAGSGPELDLLAGEAERRLAAFDAAMDDDLGTPRALAELFSLTRAFSAAREKMGQAPGPAEIRRQILMRLEALGIKMDFDSGDLPAEIKPLVEERAQARARKDWARSDALRQELKEKGFLVEDTPRGQAVRRA